MDVVPILYQGIYTPTIVGETMEKLLKAGSALVPGYMKPGGVVVFFSRTQTMFKQVFEKETLQWDRKEQKEKPPADPELEAKVHSYLQPIRLEKLMMREEQFLRDYPKTLKAIASAYMDDLVKELGPIDPRVLAPLQTKTFKFIREKYGK
jgi:hypothetical protein